MHLGGHIHNKKSYVMCNEFLLYLTFIGSDISIFYLLGKFENHPIFIWLPKNIV